MKIKSLSFLLIVFVFNAITVSAQSWLWGRQSTEFLANTWSIGVATDKTGNVYQTGGFGDSLNFGNISLYSPSYFNDMYLVKYDTAGNLLWVRQSVNTGDGFCDVHSIATDDSDNVYVAGEAATKVVFGSDTINFPSSFGGFFIAKYHANGNVAWVIEGDTIDYYNANAIAVDKNGNIYVGGGDVYGFLLKYDKYGNVVWTLPSSGWGSWVNNIATDNSGNIYVTGYFDETYFTLGSFQLSSSTGDIYIAKIDSNGTVLWAHQTNNDSTNIDNDQFSYIATDKSGAIYLTAPFEYTISLGSLKFIRNNFNNFFLVKYAPNGSIIWGEQDNGAKDSSSWESTSICTDDSNNVYVAGGDGYGLKSDAFTISNRTFGVTYSSELDVPSFLLKFDSSGNVVCGSTLPGGGGALNTVTSDSTGKFVYMGGSFVDTLMLGNTLIASTGGQFYEENYAGRWDGEACDFALTVNQPAPICDGYSDTLKATGGEDYSWSPAVGLNTTTGSTVIATPTASVTYTVSAVNSSGCSATGIDIVNIIPAPNKPTFSQRHDTLISSAVHGNQWYRNDSLLLYDTSKYLIISITGNYYVEVIDEANGCSTSSDTVDITSLTGINQLSAERGQLTVHPNPTGNQLTIISDQLQINEIDVANELGQVLLKTQTTGFRAEIDLTKFSSGIYFISVINNSGRTVVPVVKE